MVKLTDEEVDEKLSNYSDRQIVIEVINMLSGTKLIELLQKLEENY